MENRYVILQVIGNEETLLELMGNDKHEAISRAEELYSQNINVTIAVCSCLYENGKILNNPKKVVEVFPKDK